MILSIFG